MNSETMDMLMLAFAGEAILVLLIICVILIWRNIRRKKAELNAANRLASEVITNDTNRRDTLKQVFSECYNMKDDELEAVIDEFLSRERAFYKTLISVYVNRNPDEFSMLGKALEEMVTPYTDLALSAEPAGNTEAIEALQQKNEALAKELDDSKSVMDDLLAEYTSTFDKESTGITPETLAKKVKNSGEVLKAIQEQAVPVSNVNTDLQDEIAIPERESMDDLEISEDDIDIIAEEDLVAVDIDEVVTEEDSVTPVKDNMNDHAENLDLIEGEGHAEVSLDEVATDDEIDTALDETEVSLNEVSLDEVEDEVKSVSL